MKYRVLTAMKYCYEIHCTPERIVLYLARLYRPASKTGGRKGRVEGGAERKRHEEKGKKRRKKKGGRMTSSHERFKTFPTIERIKLVKCPLRSTIFPSGSEAFNTVQFHW
jgi:hypothetical protein